MQFRQGSGDPNLDGASWTYALYGQDEHRIGPRLTLNYGLRYEVNQPFAESQNHLAAFHPGQQSTIFPNAPRGLVYPADTGVPAGTYFTDKQRRAAARGDLGRERRRPDQRPGRVGSVLRHAARTRGLFQNGTLAPPFQPLTQVDFPAPIPFDSPLGGASPVGFPAGLIFIGWGPDFTTPWCTTTTSRCSVRSASGGGSRPATSDRVATTCRSSSRSTRRFRSCRRRPTLARVCSRPSAWCGRRSRRRLLVHALQASARMRPWHGLNLLIW